MKTHVIYFLPPKNDVISQLRHSYAKDPLCVTRFISLIWFIDDINELKYWYQQYKYT